MIELEINAENYDLTDDLKKHIEEKFGGLDEYLNTLERARIAVSWEGGENEQSRVSTQVWGPGHQFDASDIDWQAITAIDKAHHKLLKQIRREHSREISERNRR
ncbi:MULTISPECIES: ribosome hibernation-promoting factor, HPF/YfiA family [Microbulbifer]|uniref:Ribosomal subunit interface protein n=1 Tax=Microbulbifer rhizosphaerae TaxID=1562603 RepID=A0A7W4WFM9_9GAMM|nr:MULTISPECIES: ribosome-associated translation inhibitor RaiA [Microbulbifer]MBB3062751.1 ribosomal subunit interface protein [Microbulbifer rhizosphaerae]